MPSSPPTQCDEYQCKAPSIKGSRYCIEHSTSKPIGIERQAFNAPYKTAAWAKIRARQLSTNPLCAACLIDGRITQADHVDHLFSWQAIGQQAFTRNIFQSLCIQCHGAKSGLEKRGVFRHYVNPPHDYSVNDYPYVMTQAQ